MVLLKKTQQEDNFLGLTRTIVGKCSVECRGTVIDESVFWMSGNCQGTVSFHSKYIMPVLI